MVVVEGLVGCVLGCDDLVEGDEVEAEEEGEG